MSARSRQIPDPALNIGNMAVQRLIQSGYIQAKLQISTPQDPSEQQADRVADLVMNGDSAAQVQRKPLVREITPLVQRTSQEPLEEEEVGPLQRAPLAVREDEDEDTDRSAEETDTTLLRQTRDDEDKDREPLASVQIQRKLHALHDGGSPLPAATREFFESRFGANFSSVRLHTGGEAAGLNRAINAHAFTLGSDIYLGEGNNDLDSHASRRLLAHELTHTLQQHTQSNSTGEAPHLSNVESGLVQRDGDKSTNPNVSLPPPDAPNATTLDDQYKSALADSKWDDAARALNGFNDDDIRKRVELLERNQLEPVKEASDRVNGAASHRIRGPILSRQYRHAVEERKWADAAGHLNGLNDEGILTKITALDQSSRAELYLGAVEAMTGISRERIIGPIAKVDLNAAYGGALRQPDWPKAAEYLNGLSDDDIKARVSTLGATERASMLQAVPEWAHRARAGLLDASYKAALETGEWADAARHLNGFDEAGIQERIDAVRIDALEPLIEGANNSNGAAAFRIRYPALRRLYLNAVADDIWTSAARYLSGLSSEEIDRKLADLVTGQLSALQKGADQLGLTELVKRIAPILSQMLSAGTYELKADPNDPNLWQVHQEQLSPSYIDNVITAVAVGIYLPGYLMFAPGMDKPIIVPWEYIHYSGVALASVDGNVYNSRAEADAAVARQGGPGKSFAYYWAAGGRFTAPTTFNWATTPNIMRMAADATSRLQYEVQHELTIMAITMVGIPVLFKIIGRISRAILNIKEIPPGAVRAAIKGEGPPESGLTPEGEPKPPPAKTTKLPVLGGETEEWIELYRYTNQTGTQSPGSYWTDFPTTTGETASHLTGVPKELIKYRLTVRVNAAKKYELFRDAGSKFVPGQGGALEYRSKGPVPGEYIIDVQTIK